VTNFLFDLDIILTPLKPSRKNVTAEDVASSLYFLHLNLPSDIALLESTDPSNLNGTESENVKFPEPPITRKPLPIDLSSSTAQALRESSPAPLPWPSGDGKTSVSEVDNNPGSQTKPSADQSRQSSDPKSATYRRPLGPRPLLPEVNTRRKALPGEENLPIVTTPQIKQISTTRSSNSSHPLNSNDLMTTRIVETNSKFSEVDQDTKREFSVTIIRRDPTSGAQWNIGSITSNYLHNSHSETIGNTNSVSGAHSCIFVHLTTPGYVQFRGPQQARAIMSRTGSSMPQPPLASGLGFDRQVLMESSGLWDRKINPEQRGSMDGSGNYIGTHQRLSSDVAFESLKALGSDLNRPKSGRPKVKGYSFLSPWDGRCEFSTGGGGRSLKCKHILPNNATMSNAAASSSQPSSVVSELRFNLPTAALFGASAASTPNSPPPRRLKFGKLHHIRNKLSSDSSAVDALSKPHPTAYASLYPSTDEDNEIDDDQLDLSLGQEAAGGGNRGKRAKLGKLIVHDEGLKMLDLIVAANMGIWWQTWEH